TCSAVATAAFAWNPMLLYFSIVKVHQVNTLCGILGAILCYLRWRETGRPGPYWGMMGCVVFACLCDWPGYFVAVSLVVGHWFSSRDKRGAVLALVGVNVACFG